MKKTLIALAALAATGAFAQSAVTLYGVVDVGYNAKKWSADGETIAKGSGVVDGAVAGSRFGFRGTEDLGGGMKAEFVIEQGLSPTSAGLTNARTSTSGFQIDGGDALVTGRSASSLNRQSFVGLSGGFGAIRAGYQYTNVYELGTLSGYHAGAEGVHGADFAHLAGNGYVGGTRANAITYITPTINGFTGQFQYGAGTGLQKFEHTVDGVNQTQFEANRTSLMAKYAAGPLSAAVAYTSYKNGASVDSDTGTGATDVDFTGPIVAVTGKLTQVGVSYDLGVAKLGATYNDGKKAAAGDKVQAYTLSAAVPMGATTLSIAYHNVDEKTNAGVAITDGTGFQVGAVHNLSKRTAAYAYYGQSKYDTIKLSAGQALNFKQTDFTVGVRHSF